MLELSNSVTRDTMAPEGISIMCTHHHLALPQTPQQSFATTFACTYHIVIAAFWDLLRAGAVQRARALAPPPIPNAPLTSSAAHPSPHPTPCDMSFSVCPNSSPSPCTVPQPQQHPLAAGNRLLFSN